MDIAKTEGSVGNGDNGLAGCGANEFSCDREGAVNSLRKCNMDLDLLNTETTLLRKKGPSQIKLKHYMVMGTGREASRFLIGDKFVGDIHF